MSFMSASVASVVPDWKVLVSRMKAPSLFGTSSTVPSMVAGIMLETIARVFGDAGLQQQQRVLGRRHRFLLQVVVGLRTG